MIIETNRLKLIPCEEKYLEAFLRDENEMLQMLGVDAANNWLQFPEAIAYSLDMLRSRSAEIHWGMYFFILKDEKRLIGNGGYKGAPDSEGIVEIGYAIAPAYENLGLATEAAQGLITHAFGFENVKTIDAHTLAVTNASGRILQKCGMTKIAEKHDTEDGDIWQWRVLREQFTA